MQLNSIITIIILSIILIGCNSLESTSGNISPATGCGKEIPSATIEVLGVKQESEIGGYCWAQECGEPNGWPTPEKPVIGKSPVVIALSLQSPSPISHIEYQLRKVTKSDVMQPIGYLRNYPELQDKPIPGVIIWDIPVENVIPIFSLPNQELRLNLEPGMYVLTVFAWWKKCGDATHGFLIKVE